MIRIKTNEPTHTSPIFTVLYNLKIPDDYSKYFSYQNYSKIWFLLTLIKSLRSNKITYGVAVGFVIVVIVVDVVINIGLVFLFKQTLSIVPRTAMRKRARTLNETIRNHFLRPVGTFLKE
jgi:hypothetical protein